MRHKQKIQHGRWAFTVRRTAAAAAVAACFSGAVFIDEVRANPTAPTVVHGTATFSSAGNILNITNSPNAIINWGSFSIGVNELTRFIQQSGSSAVLNRVIGQDPSAILGALQSNGKVFLINPNGIVFGAGAQINVAGLVASTLNLSNEDFLNNRMNFTDGAGAGSVVNQGSITGGNVYLIGKAVSNDGLITSPNGEVILAAGNSVELVNPGTPNLRVEIVAPDNEAKNLGTITADAGRIGIYAGLINNNGTLRADSAVVEGGRIVLKATKNVTLAAASQTSASGASGGSVDIQAGETAIVEGDIHATGSAGAGGTVKVLGNLVGLTGQAGIDVSGDTGGGTVLVGGDYQGKNPEVQNAFRTYVGTDVTINADAITAGDGGKVIVWADDVTRFYGETYARGGAQSGNGGFVEVSGKRVLDFQGYVNTLAPHGTAGTLLLDPDFIDIVATGGTASLTSVDQFSDGPASQSINASTIEGAATNVVLQANEDINVNAPISMTNNGVGITMQAGGFLNVLGSITTRGGAITLSAGDAGSLTSPNEGALYVQAALDTTAGGLPLFSGGANITLTAPTSDVGGNSVYITQNVNAGASGAVNITGQRLDHLGGTISGGSVNVSMTSGGNGDITIAGASTIIQANGGGSVFLESDRDIKMTTGSGIVAPNGSVSLLSDSDSNDEGFILINNGVINAQSVSMTGGNGYAAGNVFANPAGIAITNGSSIIANGSVDLHGRGGAVAGGYGVLIDTSIVQNNGSSLTFVEGSGGAFAGNHGVRLNNSSIQSLGTGAVEIVGLATGTGADGVNIGASSGIFSGSSGSVRVTGSGSGGGQGINMQGAGSAFIGGANATEVLLNSLSGGMVLDGAVTACQACGSITLKSTAGADATTAALTASGLRVLGTGTFNLDSSSNSLDTVAAFLSGGPNLLHIHDQNALQVGTVSSYDGAATTASTGVNVGTGAGNIVDLHTVGALTNGGGTVTAGGQVILDAASIGATGMGNYMSINRGATGTASLTSSSGGIFVEQAAGSGNLLMSSYTISAPSGQTVALASSGGTLIVNGSLGFAGNDLELYTTGANDIQFNGGAPGTITAGLLTLEPAVGRSVFFNAGVSPWTINAPLTVGNNAAMTIGSGQTVNINGLFTPPATGTVTVGTGGTLNLNGGPTIFNGTLTLNGTIGGSADLDVRGLFNWSDARVQGSGLLITPSGSTTNIAGGVAIMGAGKTWNNAGTVNLSTAGRVVLGETSTGTFNNQAGGVVNVAVTPGGWAFDSNSRPSDGIMNNNGTININTTYTAFEAVYNNAATATLNIGAGNTLSMQNGQNIAGAVNIGAGGTLWVSEWHGTDTFFNNTIIGGTGTVQVLGSGPVAKFTNVSAPSATLQLGAGGTVQILNDATVFGVLDAAGFGSGFGITNGEFQLANGDLIVPSNASHSGVVTYLAQVGDVIVPGLVDASGSDITLWAGPSNSVKVLGGGSVLGATVRLIGNNEVIIGETTSSLPASVQATSLLEILTSGSFKLLGGSGPGAYAAASSGGALTVNATGDVILAGGSGAGSFAHLLGNPDVVLANVGGAIRMDAGTGVGSYAAIEAVSPITIYADFPTLASGGYFVNGVEGAVYDAATGTGFIAGGLPAVLDSSLIVTYGLTAPGGGSLPPVVEETIEIPTQNLIVALNESTEPPDAQKEKDVFKETEDDKKKDAPVCK